MTSYSVAQSMAYEESYGSSYVTSYLRPVATEKKIAPTAYHLHVPQHSDGSFEELRAIPKSPQRFVCDDQGYQASLPVGTNENGRPESYSAPVGRSNSYVIQRWMSDQGASDGVPAFAEPTLTGMPQDASMMALGYDKGYSQSEVYWNTNFSQQAYEPPEYNNCEESNQTYYGNGFPISAMATSECASCEIDVADPQRMQETYRNIYDESPMAAPSYHYNPGADYSKAPFNEVIDTQLCTSKTTRLPNVSTFLAIAHPPTSDQSVYRISQSDDHAADATYPHPETYGPLLSKERDTRSAQRRRMLTTDIVRDTWYHESTKQPFQEDTIIKDPRPSSGQKYPSTDKPEAPPQAGKKRITCNVCWKSFSQSANLKSHLRIHTGEKPFECSVCHRRFSQRSSVKTHMRIHTGERPFPCHSCRKTFYDSSTLIKHLRIHTGEKPYFCKICNQRFSQSGNLARHYKLHSNEITKHALSGL